MQFLEMYYSFSIYMKWKNTPASRTRKESFKIQVDQSAQVIFETNKSTGVVVASEQAPIGSSGAHPARVGSHWTAHPARVGTHGTARRHHLVVMASANGYC